MIVYEATARQAVFHAAPEMFKLYGGAMGGGKTYALCAEGIALSCDYPGNRGYICRHELKSFKRTTLLILEDMLERAGLAITHHQTDNYFLLRGGSEIFYGGLGDDKTAIDKLKSMELGWFAIDEASETSEKFFFMLVSRLRLKRPGIRYFGLLASNPDPGWLKYRFIDQKRSDYIFVPALPKDNPHLAPGYIQRLVDNFPPDWQARFINGDWGAFEGTNNVYPYQHLQAACLRGLAPGLPVVLGVDVARYGDDESVIGIRRGPVGRVHKALQGADTMTTTGEVVTAHRDEKPSGIQVDGDGLGAGVVDRLRELGIGVTEIHGGTPARDTERFKNLKAELYWGLRERLIAGDIDLDPQDFELLAQLTSCTYKINSSGQIEITPKDEMKRQGLKSPDRAEALIYAFGVGINKEPSIRRLGL